MERKALRRLDKGVSISCITRYLKDMMRDFIETDLRRKGIISFSINIPMAIQSEYILADSRSGNVRLYELNYVFSYVEPRGIMIRSIEARFVKELESVDSLKADIEDEWNKQHRQFIGRNSYYGPAKTKDKD